MLHKFLENFLITFKRLEKKFKVYYNNKKIEGDNMKPKFDSLKFCVISIIDNLFLVLVFLALFGLFKILHIFFNI